MSNPTEPQVSGSTSIQNVPLPGFYECLTLQLNVTVHPPLNSIKWVAVIREPKEQIELSREFSGLTDWTSASVDHLRTVISQALWALSWAGGKIEQ